MKERVAIAKILKPHGIKGDLKIELILKDKNYWKKCNKFYVDDKEYEMTNYSSLSDFGVIHIKDIDDRDSADLFRNKMIFIDKVMLPDTNEDEYYVQDLVGCKLTYVDGDEIGMVESIENYGSTDIINVIGSRGYISFPFLKKVILNVDFTKKIIIIDRKSFEEVCIC